MLLRDQLCLGNPEFNILTQEFFRDCVYDCVHYESPRGRAGNKTYLVTIFSLSLSLSLSLSVCVCVCVCVSACLSQNE